MIVNPDATPLRPVSSLRFSFGKPDGAPKFDDVGDRVRPPMSHGDVAMTWFRRRKVISDGPRQLLPEPGAPGERAEVDRPEDRGRQVPQPGQLRPPRPDRLGGRPDP